MVEEELGLEDGTGKGREARVSSRRGSAAKAVAGSHMRPSMVAGELGRSWSVGCIFNATCGVGALNHVATQSQRRPQTHSIA